MWKLIIIMLLCAAQIVFFSMEVWADFGEQIDLGPAFNQCMQEAEGMGQEMACYSQADKYWGKQMEEVYKQVLQNCAKTENPDACTEKVKKTQRAWLQYTAMMKDYLHEGGIPPKEMMVLYHFNAAQFEAVSTKLHYKWLKVLLE